jgi:hypothetical protein
MKFLLDNWMLISVALVSGAMLVWPTIGRAQRAGSVSPTQAVLLINRERAIVADVSETEESPPATSWVPATCRWASWSSAWRTP